MLSERPLKYADQKTERGKVLNPEYSIDRDQPTSRAFPLRINTLLCGEVFQVNLEQCIYLRAWFVLGALSIPQNPIGRPAESRMRPELLTRHGLGAIRVICGSAS